MFKWANGTYTSKIKTWDPMISAPCWEVIITPPVIAVTVTEKRIEVIRDKHLDFCKALKENH